MTNASIVMLDIVRTLRSIVRIRQGLATSVLIVASGVGLATGLFSLADPFVSRRLPYPAAQQLVSIEVGSAGVTRAAHLPLFSEWRDRSDLFVDLAGMERFAISSDCRIQDRMMRVVTQPVTPGFFETLGIPVPRFPEQQDSAQEIPIVLTRSGAQRLGDSGSLQCGDKRLSIIAILPKSFRFPDASHARVDGFQPYWPSGVIRIDRWTTEGTPAGRGGGASFIGRISPGRQPQDVQTALATPLPSGRALSVVVEPLTDRMTRSIRPIAVGALIATGLVLFVCAGNFANLSATRSLARVRDCATCVSLGATPGQLARGIVTEFSVIATVSGAIGLAIGAALVKACQASIPLDFLRLGEPSFGLRSILFGMASASVVTVFGALPALYATLRPAVDRRRAFATDPRSLRILKLLFIGAQSALAMVLVCGGVLLSGSYINLQRQTVGIDPNVKVLNVSIPFTVSGSQVYRDGQQTLKRLESLASGALVAMTDAPIVDAGMNTLGLEINGQIESVQAKRIAGAFFDVTSIQILSGRSARPDGALEALVSVSLAKHWWPDGSAIGREVTIRRNSPPLRVVGIVQDIFDRALDVKPKPTIYLPFDITVPTTSLRILVKSEASLEQVVQKAQAILLETAPYMVVVDSGTVSTRLSATVQARTFATLILGVYAFTATVVAIVGVIGVVAYGVARRTSEIALRSALGASPFSILLLVVGETLSAVMAGGLVGAYVGHVASTALASFAYEVNPGSWNYIVVAYALFVPLAAIASFIPARRALLLQPHLALRSE